MTFNQENKPFRLWHAMSFSICSAAITVSSWASASSSRVLFWTIEKTAFISVIDKSLFGAEASDRRLGVNIMANVNGDDDDDSKRDASKIENH